MFGILKRGTKTYTKIVVDTKSSMLMLIITSKIAPDSMAYTDCYRSYSALNIGDFYHERINQSGG